MSNIRLLIKGRDKGKTTGLIYTSEATGYPIIVQTSVMKDYITKQAKEMGINIPEPIEFNRIKDGYRKKGGTLIKHIPPTNVLIDDSYDIIGDALDAYLGCHVVAATLTDRIKGRNNINNN